MSESTELSDNWRIVFARGFGSRKEVAGFVDTNGVPALIEIFQQFPVCLKDDYRSLVMRGNLNQVNGNCDVDVIAKQNHQKNRRRWPRLLSLFRRSEALYTQDTLVDFLKHEVPSVAPMFVLEQKRWGMVVDSWLVYQYRDGEPSSREQLPRLLKLLQDLHRAGMRHEDPNYGNFLIDDQSMFLIDCKGKPRRGSFSDYIDYFLVASRNNINIEDIDEIVGFDKSSIGYRIARFYQHYRDARTRLKKRLRSRKHDRQS